MKKDYNTKKKAAIAALSIVAVCLAGGLFYYTGTMGGQPQEAPVESTAPVETQVVMPEITTEPSSTTEPQAETEPTPSTEPAKATGTETENSFSGSNTQDTTQSKPSDGKPKSPSEATPPSSPPTETENGSAGSSESEQPQAGEKRSDGKVYFPGFGWVEDEGENSQGTAPNAGTGEPVGDM